MRYINLDTLLQIDPKAYQTHKPYPYIDITAPLYDDAYARLTKTAPSDLSLFEKQFGIARSHGQKSHDKYFLEYHKGLPLSPEWQEFIRELHSPEYLGFLERLFGIKKGTYTLVLSWHYMTSGSSISPHCDTARKIGSQLFYLNTKEEWDPSWGGQTLAMDDHGERNPYSGPELSAFDSIFTSRAVGNTSFIFSRTDHSWHAVDTIKCPPGIYRKMFSVVLNRAPTQSERIKTYLKSALPKSWFTTTQGEM